MAVSRLSCLITRRSWLTVHHAHAHFSMASRNKFITNKAYIGGEWLTTARTFEVRNPATNAVLGSVSDCGSAETQTAVEAADAAFPAWSARSPMSRADSLLALHNLLLEEADAIAEVMTLECGKPLAEAKGEVAYAASFIRWFAEEARRLYGDVVPSPTVGRRMLLLRQPVGVCGLITPWNFPLAMIARKVAAAFAAGCTVVVKPAEDTPYTALAFGYLADKMELPRGVLSVVPCSRENAPIVGRTLCGNPQVAKISFTGSTPVGKLLMKEAADTVQRVSMELGGNAPFIVFPTASASKVEAGIRTGKTRNCGQACNSANRFLVHEDVYDSVVETARTVMASLKIGNGMAEGVTQGPLINRTAALKVQKLVSEAVADGARLVLGGGEADGNFYPPTVLADVTPKMRIFHSEIFGPVASLSKFRTESEAIRLANSTRHGLMGYFFSEDLSQIWRVAEALQCGMVGVNEGFISMAETTFGGWKESGFGVEGSRHGTDEYLQWKYVCFGGLDETVPS